MLNSNTIFKLKYLKAKEKIQDFSRSFVARLGGGIKSRQEIRKYNILNILINFLGKVASEDSIENAKSPNKVLLSNITFHPDFQLIADSFLSGIEVQNKNLSIVLKVLLLSSISNNFYNSNLFKNLICQEIVKNVKPDFKIKFNSNKLEISAAKTSKYNGGSIISNKSNDGFNIINFNSNKKFEYGVSRLDTSNFILATIVNLNSLFDKIAISLKFKYKEAVKYKALLNVIDIDNNIEQDLMNNNINLLSSQDGNQLVDSDGNVIIINLENNIINNNTINNNTNVQRQNY
jgi:hypothetical protein